jgi:N-acetylneuraminic acid mutarotase
MTKFFTHALVFLAPFALHAQFTTEVAQLPEPVSNNAVAATGTGDSVWLYSFCGIDSTKKWSGIHLKAWRIRPDGSEVQELPNVPDPAGGKIAAAASVVKGRIYVIGGYHVASNGNETSSKKVHRFDPATASWLSDGAPLPVAIDDQVQSVWRDSLIFVVTGWSNNQNVPNVQIYNPAADTWLTGTPVPNNNNYKAFGASGVILGDTIYYCGGASGANGFPASNRFRKGYIDPNNPTQVTWTETANSQAVGYRMAAGLMSDHVVWVGGSNVTYNFNGIAYNGSGGVPALSRLKDYSYENGALWETIFADDQLPPIMDLRGTAQVDGQLFYTLGGMEPGQKVSNKVIQYNWYYTPDNLSTLPTVQETKLSPNPASEWVRLEQGGVGDYYLYDMQGRLCSVQLQAERANVAGLENGVYALVFYAQRKVFWGKFLVAR